MRKLPYILPIILHSQIIYADVGVNSNINCREMTVEGNNNEVTFCIEGALFSSNTYHPNEGANNAPTTCKQLGLIDKPGANNDIYVRLLQGTCTNGMPAPIASLECNIESNDLYCLYDGKHKLHLKPTHNKSFNLDGANDAPPS